ncbi:tyrosine-protein kinase BTK-like [Halichondria panicea]|uniref:tyrosine-protein kinase BTK-like n=1 Tax=Halichondria panicea TaxID=6063 RepID=UPI00312B8CE7
MPGNQASPDRDDVELKVSYMVKRSQGKSTLGAVNFKKRVFVLSPTRLSYYEGTIERRGGMKGYVDLSKVKVIEKVLDGAFDKPSFQIGHSDLTLYIIASSDAEQQEWIALLRQYCRSNVILQDRFHPGIFTGKWSCCDHRSKHSQGCRESFILQTQPAAAVASPPVPSAGGARIPRGPLPPTPAQNLAPSPPPHGYQQNSHGPPAGAPRGYESHELTTHTSPSSVGRSSYHSPAEPPPPPLPTRPRDSKPTDFEVIAMYEYPGLERGDLSLLKGQRVTVFDSTREFWWRARDEKGNEGYIPSNYVKKMGLDSEEWFFPQLSRTRAENILKGESREGGFVVRNSSREDMYTLSICHEGQVRHYHIKLDETNKYFISEKHRFPSIKELIEYHKLNGGGLVTRLRKPPVQLAPNPQSLGPLFDEAWEIEKVSLSLGKELGSGQFGRVVAGRWKGKIDVAIKMMREGAMNEDDFIEEAKVMKQFQHENLVKLFGVCTKNGPIFIVQELMVNGCLLQFLRQRKELVEKTEIILDMATQVCAAMLYLEENGFIHRDLAARNCLVGDRNVVKVADFGLARFVVDDEYTASEGTKFPIKWAAPEVITHAKFSSKSDVWSFGILLWELWTGGKTPYPTFTNSQVLDEVLMGYRLDRPKHCPPEVYTLMSKCWLTNSDDRPQFKVLSSSLGQMNSQQDDDYSETVDD